MLTTVMMLATLGQAPVVLPPRPAFSQKQYMEHTATSTKARVVTTVTYRAPVGHTHTCSQCGTTWDHQTNSTHKCANCGSFQYYQDVPSRQVTVRKTVTESVSTPMPVAPVTIHQSIRSVTRSTSNCPNGNCPYVR